MAELTIHNLDPAWLKRLEERAAANGRSVEDEARAIIEERLPRGCGIEELRRLLRESQEYFRGRILSDSTDDIREDRER